ncbi:hypothetical protein BDV06DRAFT_8246 [Aspergillus oleicola]
MPIARGLVPSISITALTEPTSSHFFIASTSHHQPNSECIIFLHQKMRHPCICTTFHLPSPRPVSPSGPTSYSREAH